MKVVIVSQNCFPFISPRANRATELAKEFARQGHDVSLYALLGDIEYYSFEHETVVKVKSLGKSRLGLLDNSNHRNNNIIYKLFGRFLGRFFDFPKIELMKMTLKVIQKENKIDLLVTIAHPHTIHWGAAKYIKRHPDDIKCWVADCGDPYMLNPHAKYPFYFEWVEKWWCNLCDFITIPIEGAKSAYYQEFGKKIKVIPQGFDFENNKLSDYCKNDVPTFAYAGIFYKDLRDPINFLNYLCEMKNDFRFIIYTNDTTYYRETFKLNEYKSKLGEKLIINPFIPREQLIYELSKMDFVINIKNTSGVQQPSKLIDYALTRRPIIEISSSFCEKDIFEKFMVGDYSSQITIKNIEQYNISNVAKQMLQLVEYKNE